MHTENFLRFFTAYAEDQARTQGTEERNLQTQPAPAIAASVYRIDKFMVPPAALPAFIEKMTHIQRTLRALPGCRLALTLKQTGGSGEFNVVTFVEWVNAQAVSAATASIQQQFANEGFDPASFVRNLRVHGDLGFYDVAGCE